MTILAGFKRFSLRGNFIDLAVGFTVGAAFTTIALSFVSDVLMPPLGYLIGQTDFSNLYWTINPGATKPGPYATLADARDAGAVTLNYGLFLNNVVAFLLVAFAMFLLVHAIQRIDRRLEEKFGKRKPAPGEPTEKKCPYCLSTVPFKATRCA